MGGYDGKSGLVTGAAQGIGRASAMAFAAEGANVLVSDVDETGGAQTVEIITAAGGQASFQRCDVTKEGDVESLVAAVVDRYGRIDWAHNNAGIAAPMQPITNQDTGWWDDVLAVDVVGVMFCIKHEVTAMIAQGDGGAIVNTASTAGFMGVPWMSQYSASKWAVIGLTKSAALENAQHGIRVNALCPGSTMTEGIASWAAKTPPETIAEMSKLMNVNIPMGRPAQPEEQADAAVWLCSGKASYVTGIALPVDGGQTAG